MEEDAGFQQIKDVFAGLRSQLAEEKKNNGLKDALINKLKKKNNAINNAIVSNLRKRIAVKEGLINNLYKNIGDKIAHVESMKKTIDELEKTVAGQRNALAGEKSKHTIAYGKDETSALDNSVMYDDDEITWEDERCWNSGIAEDITKQEIGINETPNSVAATVEAEGMEYDEDILQLESLLEEEQILRERKEPLFLAGVRVRRRMMVSELSKTENGIPLEVIKQIKDYGNFLRPWSRRYC